MARQWRIEYPGAIYHVFSRGNRHQDIFLSDKDRRTFLELLDEISERYGIEVHAYVLMANHYHLLLKTPDPNLSKAMQWLGTTYTHRFHAHNRTDGHLFQGRFKSILVENDAYLLQLSYYIHRNPVRAGIVERLSDYYWSSYPYYAYKVTPPDWLVVDFILGQVNSKEPQKAYRQKVKQYAGEIDRTWEDVRHGLVYGSQGFVEQCKRRFLKGWKEAELPQHNRLFMDEDPQKLARKAADAFGFDWELGRSAKRIPPRELWNRDMVIYFLWETGKLSHPQIGDLMNLTYSNISRRVSIFQSAMKENKERMQEYARLKSLIKV